jgi:hypothetical protein
MTWRTLAALIAISAAGCGSKMPSAADPERARASLTTALDAWRNGDSPDTLQKRSPAIYFNDEVWQSKVGLAGYEITNGESSGRGYRCDVNLVLHGGEPNAPRRVSYLVDTHPAIVIVQQP